MRQEDQDVDKVLREERVRRNRVRRWIQNADVFGLVDGFSQFQDWLKQEAALEVALTNTLSTAKYRLRFPSVSEQLLQIA